MYARLYEHTKIHASLCACSRPSIMLAAGGRDPGASAASTDRSCMAYGAELEEKRREQARKERSSSKTHNEKAGCEMHAWLVRREQNCMSWLLAPPCTSNEGEEPTHPTNSGRCRTKLDGQGLSSRGGQTIMWWARLMAWTCHGHRREREGRVDSCCNSNSNSRERQGVSD